MNSVGSTEHINVWFSCLFLFAIVRCQIKTYMAEIQSEQSDPVIIPMQFTFFSILTDSEVFIAPLTLSLFDVRFLQLVHFLFRLWPTD